MLGAATGGAVRLADAASALVVAEGIETALSLLCGPLCGPVMVYAALSTSGMSGLHLPLCPSHLIIATDGDTPGKLAGSKLASRALALGWEVTMFAAPDGQDWNDVLQAERRGAV